MVGRKPFSLGKSWLEEEFSRRTAGLAADNLRLQLELRLQRRTSADRQVTIDRFQNIADSAPALIAYVNAGTLRYEFANINYADICGQPRDKIIGSHMRAVLGEGVFQDAEAYIAGVRSGKNVSYEGAFITALGKRWLHVTYRPIFDADGQVASFVVMSWDITDLKLAEEKIHSLLAEKESLLIEMERLAITDPLTGAYNRRHFCEVGASELARAKRTGHALSLIMFDLDHFKKINDTAGHHIGDEVLKTVVARLRPILRESDTLGRLGGEEFFILLPETNGEAAEATAERLRSLIENIDSVRPGNTALRFTASFGVSQIDAGIIDFGAILQQVDVALYQAKAAGRNCVIRIR